MPLVESRTTVPLEPWFFRRFGGGWRFAPGEAPGTTAVTWRCHYATRPRLIEPVATGCLDPVVAAAAAAREVHASGG